MCVDLYQHKDDWDTPWRIFLRWLGWRISYGYCSAAGVSQHSTSMLQHHTCLNITNSFRNAANFLIETYIFQNKLLKYFVQRNKRNFLNINCRKMIIRHIKCLWSFFCNDVISRTQYTKFYLYFTSKQTLRSDIYAVQQDTQRFSMIESIHHIC